MDTVAAKANFNREIRRFGLVLLMAALTASLITWLFWWYPIQKAEKEGRRTQAEFFKIFGFKFPAADLPPAEQQALRRAAVEKLIDFRADWEYQTERLYESVAASFSVRLTTFDEVMRVENLLYDVDLSEGMAEEKLRRLQDACVLARKADVRGVRRLCPP